MPKTLCWFLVLVLLQAVFASTTQNRWCRFCIHRWSSSSLKRKELQATVMLRIQPVQREQADLLPSERGLPNRAFSYHIENTD